MSTKAEVLSFLASKTEGYNTLTAQQMRTKFGVANPSALINQLRNEGYAIYLNSRTLSNGEKVSSYRLGTPTRRMVAAGIRAIRDSGDRAFA